MELVIYERQRYKHALFPIFTENYDCHLCEKKFTSFRFVEAHYLHNHKQNNIVLVLKYGNHVEIKRQFLGPKSKAPEHLTEIIQYSDVDDSSDSDCTVLGNENDPCDPTNVLNDEGSEARDYCMDESAIIDDLVSKMVPLLDDEVHELEKICTTPNSGIEESDKIMMGEYDKYLQKFSEDEFGELQFFKFLVGIDNTTEDPVNANNTSGNQSIMELVENVSCNQDTEDIADSLSDNLDTKEGVNINNSVATDEGNDLSESEAVSESEDFNFDLLFDSKIPVDEVQKDFCNITPKDEDQKIFCNIEWKILEEESNDSKQTTYTHNYIEHCEGTGLLTVDNTFGTYTEAFNASIGSEDFDLMDIGL